MSQIVSSIRFGKIGIVKLETADWYRYYIWVWEWIDQHEDEQRIALDWDKFVLPSNFIEKWE